MLKLATIGTSWITEQFIDAAEKSGRFKLRSVFSRDIKKAEEFKERRGAAYASDSFEDIAESDIDTVYLASPNKLHFEQAEYFLRKGKHVICEKPIVTKSGQLLSLFKTARQNDVFLFEALRHIHTPGFKIIKNNICNISPVQSAFLSYNQYSSKYDAFKEGNVSNVFSSELDGGAKFDLGVYPVSFAVALFGAPLSVRYASHNLTNGTCGSGAYIFEYEGFLCCIMFSKTSDDIAENQIIGEKGGISFNRPAYFDRISMSLRGEKPKDISEKHDENPLLYEAIAFADIIENNNIAKYNELSEISITANEILISY